MQQLRDYLFAVTNGKREKRLTLAAGAGPSFSGIYGQRTMPHGGAKKKKKKKKKERNVLHLLQAQQALVCLWSISKTLPCQKFHGNGFQEGMLESDGPMGQCFSRFPTVSQRGEGGGGEEEGSG